MRKFTTALLTGSALLLFTACGGSNGSNSSGRENAKSMVSITSENADTVIAGTTISGALYLSNEGVLPYSTTVTDTIAKSTTRLNKLANIASVDLEPGVLAESGTESCTDGGSVSYNGDETSGGTATFDQCNEGGIIINGTMVLSVKGTDSTTTLTDFSIKAKVNGDNVDAYYQTATVLLNTNTYDMSITATGHASENGNRFDFENYSMKKTGNSYIFAGLVKTDCMGGWIEIKTNHALVLSQAYSCPTAGEIIVSGNNSEMKFVFNPDISVDVTINGEAYKRYDSCDELPDSCK